MQFLSAAGAQMLSLRDDAATGVKRLLGTLASAGAVMPALDLDNEPLSVRLVDW
jgi:hypothetical protein